MAGGNTLAAGAIEGAGAGTVAGTITGRGMGTDENAGLGVGVGAGAGAGMGRDAPSASPPKSSFLCNPTTLSRLFSKISKAL